MTSKLVVNTIESDTGISSVSFASSISMSSTSKFFFSAAGIDIGADTNINRPAAGVIGFNVNGTEKVRIDSSGHMHGVGVVTATHFYGDGSNLTGLPAGTTINNNADNRLITGSGTANTLNAESNLTYNGGTILKQTLDDNTTYSATATPQMGFQAHNQSNTTNSFSALRLTAGSASPATAQISSLYTGAGQNDLTFQLETGNTAFEAMRITSGGNIGVSGNTGTDFSLLDGIVVNTGNGNAGLLINSSSSSHNAYLGFSYGSGSGTSHADQFSAYIGRVGDDTLILGTGNTPRQTIDNNGNIMTSGNVNINRSSNAGEPLTVRGPAEGDAIRIERAGSYQWFIGNDTTAGKSNLYFKANNNKEVVFPSTGGIAFNGEASDNNALNDYEEGSWNPTYTTHGGSVGSVSYSHQDGYYVKIGHTVWVSIDITVSTASGMSGNTCIGGFPFQNNFRHGQGYYYAGTMNWYIQNHHSNNPVFTGWMMGNASLLRIYNGSHWNNLSHAPLNTTGRMSFSLWYTTNS